MRLPYHWLERAAILYIYFPLFLFGGGWLRSSIAIPLISIFAYVFYKRYFKYRSKEKSDLVIEKGVFLFVLAGIVV